MASMLASLLVGDVKDGKLVAKGKDEIVAKLKGIAEKLGTTFPERRLDDLTRKMERADSVELYEMPDGNYVVKGTGVKGNDSGESNDLEQLLNAMNFHDRHGGRSAFGDFHFETLDRAFGGRGERREKTPLEKFMATVNKTPDAKEPEKRLMVLDLSLAASIAATEVARFSRVTNDDGPEAARAFAALVLDCEVAEPVKFKNLAGYLDAYSVNLKHLMVSAGEFAGNPSMDFAEGLSRDLAAASHALINSMRDAEDKATRLAEDALNI